MVLAQANVLLEQFQWVTESSRSILIPASIAVLARVLALQVLSRLNSLRNLLIKDTAAALRAAAAFLCDKAVKWPPCEHGRAFPYRHL